MVLPKSLGAAPAKATRNFLGVNAIAVNALNPSKECPAMASCFGLPMPFSSK